jgi:hypothetical protein
MEHNRISNRQTGRQRCASHATPSNLSCSLPGIFLPYVFSHPTHSPLNSLQIVISFPVSTFSPFLSYMSVIIPFTHNFTALFQFSILVLCLHKTFRHLLLLLCYSLQFLLMYFLLYNFFNLVFSVFMNVTPYFHFP